MSFILREPGLLSVPPRSYSHVYDYFGSAPLLVGCSDLASYIGDMAFSRFVTKAHFLFPMDKCTYIPLSDASWKS
jgi:hypothetical protein